MSSRSKLSTEEFSRQSGSCCSISTLIAVVLNKIDDSRARAVMEIAYEEEMFVVIIKGQKEPLDL